MKFISIRKFKFYTKEFLKVFNISLLALGFIIAIVLIKYKPMYEVKISGEEVGYIKNKNILNKSIEENIVKYRNKNINIELLENPEYELKLVERTKESNEDEIIIALQKNVEIKYKYYEVAFNEQIIEKVNSLDSAEKIVNDIKELTNNSINLSINTKITKDIENLQTNTLEIAKQNIIERLDINAITNSISDINGVKIGTVPVSGYISSRYGVRSRLRSSTHTGLDIAASEGTPIKVIAQGTVTYAGWYGPYGLLVKVDHGKGVETWYAHTSKINVKKGQKVNSGDIIALVGNTGNSTGAHLHLEIRINGVHVNPQKYLYK